MFSLELSTQSKEYIEKLKIYLIENFSEKVKKVVLNKEEEKLENLQKFPYLGMKASKISKLLIDYYVLIDKNEYIFYRVNEKKKIISVELILSTKEDIIKKAQKYFS